MSDPRDLALKLIDQLVEVTGLTRSRLAIKAGVEPSTVNRHFKHGATSSPNASTLIMLAGAAKHRLVIVPIQNAEEKPARPDPDLLRLAMVLALRHVSDEEPDRAAGLGRIALLAYNALADGVAEMGHPFASDADALAFGAAVVREHMAGRRQK